MKYIAFFDLPGFESEKRYANMAAAQVVTYMIDVFSSVDSVEVISPSRTLHKKGYFKARTTKISENAQLVLPPTFGANGFITRFLSRLWIQLWLFWYLLIHTKVGEKVVFYHSLSIMTTIKLLTVLKRIKPILEFREIYSDIDPVSAWLKRKEHSFYTCAYGYIFPSEALKNLLNIGNKPYVLAPGSYTVYIENKNKFNDGKIHLVYAGNFRKDKGGAYVAIECSKQLDEQYVIHILGRDNENCIKELCDTIKLVEQRGNAAKIIYEGYKSGQELYDFLAKCDIGLAVQKPGAFNNSSFPSKILIYLGCGLSVISPNIDAVKLSPVSSLVTLYDSEDISSLTSAIKSGTHTSDPTQEIRRLDCDLRQQLSRILSKDETN